MYHLCFIVRSMATEAQDRVYLKSLRETVDAKQCVPLLCKVKGCKAVSDTYVHKLAAEPCELAALEPFALPSHCHGIML